MMPVAYFPGDGKEMPKSLKKMEKNSRINKFQKLNLPTTLNCLFYFSFLKESFIKKSSIL